MILVAGNGAPQYRFDIDEDISYSTLDSCTTTISDPEFRFKDKMIALVRLSCIPEDKVEEFKDFMEKNNK